MAPVLAFAADVAHGEEHASSGGLPQFDPTWFPSQIFWLAITFAAMYAFFHFVILPDLFAIKSQRQNKIDGDLKRAEEMQEEAATLRDACENELQSARTQAEGLIQGQETTAKKKLEESLASFRAKAEKQITDTEARVKQNQTKVMADVEQIAADIANEAAQKIIGQPTDRQKAHSIVQQLRQNQEAA